MQNDQNSSDAPKMVPCPHCGGTGWMVRDPDIGTDQECFVCDGTGEIPDPDEDDK